METSTGKKLRRANPKIVAALVLTLSVLVPTGASAQRVPPERYQSYPVGNDPFGMAFDGTNIWVTSLEDEAVTELRASDGSLVATVPIGTTSFSATFDGTYVWVLDQFPLSVTRLRPADGTIEGAYPLGDYYPQDILFDGENIWICTSEALLFELRQSDAAVLATYDLSRTLIGSSRLAFDGRNIWVTDWNSNQVVKLRASDGLFRGTFATGPYPYGIAFDGTSIWIANAYGDSLTKLRPDDGRLLDTIPVAQNPLDVKFDGQHIWITCGSSHMVQRLGVNDDLIERSYETQALPQRLVFDGANMWVFVWSDPATVTELTPKHR